MVGQGARDARPHREVWPGPRRHPRRGRPARRRRGLGPYPPRSRQPPVLRLRRDGERRREPRRVHGRVRGSREVSDRRSGDALKLRLHLRFRAGYTPSMEDPRELGGFDWEGADDITALSEEDLRGRLEALTKEERAV